jgi:nucleoside-diphosphate-sugar epimerase
MAAESANQLRDPVEAAAPGPGGVVLITGYAGAIGSAVAARLAKHYRVVGFDRGCESDSACIEADIGSGESLTAAFAALREQYGGRIASVIHLAAYFDMTGAPNPLYDKVNVEGTRRLLEALSGFEVEQFVYASTMLVHAPTVPGRPIDEAAPIDPKWAYPKSKLDAENVVRTQHGNIPVLVLRIAGMYTDHCESATLAQQMQRIHQRSLIGRVFPGDISHGQAFVHLDDLCDAFALAVERRKRLPADLTLLIGEPETPSYAQLQDGFAQAMHGQPWPTAEIPKSVAKTGAWLQDKAEDVVPDAIDQGEEPFIKPYMIDLADDHFELDIRRAREALGWQPKHRLATRLPRLVEVMKADPGAWYARNKLRSPAGVTPQQRAALDERERDELRDHAALMAQLHRDTLWAHFVVAFLGVWLVFSPAACSWRCSVPCRSAGGSPGRSGRTSSSAPGCCSRRCCSGRRARRPTQTTPWWERSSSPWRS